MRIREVEGFGAIARQRRRDLGLTQAQLAEKSGVTRQWLVRFENGNTDVALSKVYAVLKALELTARVNPADELNVNSPTAGRIFMIPTVDLSTISMKQIQDLIDQTAPDEPSASHPSAVSSAAHPPLKRSDA